MRSAAILLVLMYACMSYAQVIGLVHIGQISYHGSSFQQFGVSFTNGLSGNGLINSFSNVAFLTIPSSDFSVFNAQGSAPQYSGQIHSINAQATGWGSFSVPSSAIGNSVYIVVSYQNWNGEEAVAFGTFQLSSAKRDVEAEDIPSAIIARGTAPTISPGSDWSAVQDTATWNTFDIHSGTATLYNVAWSVHDPQELTVITYPLTGTSYPSIPANNLKQTSVQLQASYGTYYLNLTVSYYLAQSTSLGAQQWASFTKEFDVTSGKRAGEKVQSVAAKAVSAQPTLRTEYAIGIASAGVAVAAVAVVAAVVIIRRKKDISSSL